MLPRARRGFFLSEYTIRVILLLIVAMIVIKFCSDMIDLRTENNPAVRSRNAVKGLAEAIGEVAKCSPKQFPLGNPASNPVTVTAADANSLRDYMIDEKNLERDACLKVIPFSFDFNNWYFSINTRDDPSDPSKDIVVISYFEKIPDGFSLDWTSGSIPIQIDQLGTYSDDQYGALSSDNDFKIYGCSGFFPSLLCFITYGDISTARANVDRLILYRFSDTKDTVSGNPKIKLLIYVDGEYPGDKREGFILP